MQAVCTLLAQKWLAGQTVHAATPSLPTGYTEGINPAAQTHAFLLLPVPSRVASEGHGVQAAWPELVWYVFSAQAVQTLDEVPPVVLENVPARHSVHAAGPGSSL